MAGSRTPNHAAAERISERARLLGLCGKINPLTQHVCNVAEDHEGNHAARKLGANGDPKGRPYAIWANLVAL